MSRLELKELYAGFRDAGVIKALSKQISKEAERLCEPLCIMEVCGGHTHTIMKYGLKQLLPQSIEFVHGPGCPVCIMPKERIDQAIALSGMKNLILVTLGDMLYVPGSLSTLAKERAQGCDVRALYSPMDALAIALQNPDKTVVYFAIGFETTTPMTAALLQQAQEKGIKNLLFHINHVLVPPAVDAIMQDGEARVNAFIAPSHVSVISGAKIYRGICENYATPVVVSGFEPVDVMQSIAMIVRQKNEQRCELEIEYSRCVTMEGNLKAQEMIEKYMKPRENFRWRGVGDIPFSALELKVEFEGYDAEKIFASQLPSQEIDDHKLCICAKILKGLANPEECSVFGTACTPNQPLGSCMVSSEGSCNAYYRYAQV
ncbi:MAG: hydrogenase formation protein HypD [Campylobacterales bacterium]|nr:hydrogenase formation protein HypD [Campylobacterales bacterium]